VCTAVRVPKEPPLIANGRTPGYIFVSDFLSAPPVSVISPLVYSPHERARKRTLCLRVCVISTRSCELPLLRKLTLERHGQTNTARWPTGAVLSASLHWNRLRTGVAHMGILMPQVQLGRWDRL